MPTFEISGMNQDLDAILKILPLIAEVIILGLLFSVPFLLSRIIKELKDANEHLSVIRQNSFKHDHQ